MKSKLEEYLSLVGKKRLKRTNDEVDRGLTPEQAAAERLADLDKPVKKKAKPTKDLSFKVAVRPDPKADLSHYDMKSGSWDVTLTANQIGWMSELLESYRGNRELVFQHIIDLGIGEMLTNFQSSADVEEFISTGRKYFDKKVLSK